MLPVLTNQFFLGSNNLIYLSLKLKGFNSIIWESVVGGPKREYFVVIDGRTEISDTIDSINYIPICIVIIIQREEFIGKSFLFTNIKFM